MSRPPASAGSSESPASQPTPPPPAPLPAGGGTVDILLVDDRPENILALEAILEPLGQRLVRAYSGEQALREVLRRDPSVILLDVQMPGMSGFETARLIKARERSRHIPIIFLTAINKDQQFVFEGYSVGAVDYMFKPLQPDVLRSKVASFVELALKTRELQRHERLLRESERRELELRHRAALLESEARFATVVNTALDAIIMYDAERRITAFNPAAERLFGLGARQAIGRRVDDLLEPADEGDDLTAAGNGVSAAPGDGASGTAPRLRAFVGRRATGERFPMEASLSEGVAGGRRTVTLIGRDVTARRAAEQALRARTLSLADATAELQTVNRALHERQQELERAISSRSRFYASMSHELRTPLNAIIGYNTLLLDQVYGELSERQTYGIQRALRAARHLLELVNDVLDLSKIEAGKLELDVQQAAFPSLIEDLFVTVRPMADERGSTLSLAHDGPPRTIVTDPRRVRQILLNLLSNAIKFGDGHPIEVRSRALDDGGIQVEVEDRGIGIAATDLSKIFDEFVQLGHGRREHEGTGLGLPISKRLAVLLDGSLDATSTLGEGSTFRLRLPGELRTVPPSGAEQAERDVTPPAPDVPADRAQVEGEHGAEAIGGEECGVRDAPAHS